jgi:hypothetical protein
MESFVKVQKRKTALPKWKEASGSPYLKWVLAQNILYVCRPDAFHFI